MSIENAEALVDWADHERKRRKEEGWRPEPSRTEVGITLVYKIGTEPSVHISESLIVERSQTMGGYMAYLDPADPFTERSYGGTVNAAVWHWIRKRIDEGRENL